MRILRSAVLAMLVMLAASPLKAQDRLPVVATMSILADLVRNVGGDRVEVTELVGRAADAHVYSPTPADAKRLAASKLIVVNGLGFEGWMKRLVKASGTKAPQVIATKGVAALREAKGHEHSHKGGDQEGSADPHAWQSVANVKIYVGNIRDALIEADPDSAATYNANAAAYQTRLDALEAEIRIAIGRLPDERRKVITTHDAFGYFDKAYGVAFIAPQGVSTEAEITARDVARIVRQIKAEKIAAVFLENVSDARLMQRIAAESGAKIGGTLYSDALSDDKGPAPTYLDMMRHNLRELLAALAG